PATAYIAQTITIDPSGRFAYVAGGGNVATYSIDTTTGALSLLRYLPYVFAQSPRSVAVDPSDRFAYVVSFNNILAYTIDATTGVLNPVPGSPFAGGAGSPVVVDATGRFAYV